MATETDWAAKIEEGRRRVDSLRRDISAGVPEAEAARKNGFHTAGSFQAEMDARVADLRAKGVIR